MAKKKDPTYAAPGNYFDDVPSWNDAKRASARRNRLADNSPSYSKSEPEYEWTTGTGGSRKVKKRSVVRGARYILRTSRGSSATGTSGQRGEVKVKSSWEEVPLNYVPKQGETVYQGPAGQSTKVNPQSPQFHKVPVGGWQKTVPQITQRQAFDPAVFNPQRPPVTPNFPQNQTYGGSANAAEERQKRAREAAVYEAMNSPGGSVYDSQVPKAAGMPGGVGINDSTGGLGGSGSIPQDILNALDDLGAGTGLEYKSGDPVQVHLPDFPDAPNFTFKRNDFSDEANKAMAKAYGPRYAAIDAAKASVVEAQARSDEIVKGIYQELYADLSAGATRTKEDYDAAGAAAVNSGRATAKDIRQGAANSNAQMAAEFEAMGLTPQEIAATMAGSSEATNTDANAALAAGQANQQFMAAQGGGATDFANTMATAANNQGAVSREQIAADAAQAVQGYSNQAIDLSGQQSIDALGMAQNLSEQDMGLQQMQYGVLSDRYQGAVGEWNAGAANAYQNADLVMADRSMDQNQAQFDYQQLTARQTARAEMATRAFEAMKAGEASEAETMQKLMMWQAEQDEDRRRWEAEHGLALDKNAADIAAEDRRQTEVEREGQEPEAGQTADVKPAEGLAEFASKAATITGSDPAELNKYYSIFINEMNQNGTFGAVAEPAFVTQMTTKYANAPGINPMVLGQVASLFHRIMYKSPTAAIQG